VPVGIVSRDDTSRNFGRVDTSIAKVSASTSARSGLATPRGHRLLRRAVIDCLLSITSLLRLLR
jgi:hypothetical protein